MSMDIDSFAQCLSFVQATTITKPPVEKYLPIIGTLLGTGVGFGLNQVVTRLKDGKSKKNKQTCCYEECHELKHLCSEMVKALVEAAGLVAQKKRPASHTFPFSIRLPLMDEYYPEVAHSFSSNQRHWIRYILRNVTDINDSLSKALSQEDKRSIYKISAWIVDLLSVLIDTYKMCDQILLDKKIAYPDDDKFLLSLGCDKEDVDFAIMLGENIGADNSKFGLPN